MNKFLFFICLFVVFFYEHVTAEVFCNNTEFDGPNCEYKNCGLNGRLNSDGTSCICDYGFTGSRCGECTSSSLTDLNREYVCCALFVGQKQVDEYNDPSDWFLVAPKTRDVFRFMSGFYSKSPCLRQGAYFHYNETATYSLNCDCKLTQITNLEKRNIINKNKSLNDTIKMPVRKRTLSISKEERFWREEINKRDVKRSNSYLNPATLADFLIGEAGYITVKANDQYNSFQNNVLGNKLLNVSNNPVTIGTKLIILLIIIAIAILVVIIFLIFYVCFYYRKEFKTLKDIQSKFKSADQLKDAIQYQKKLLSKNKTKEGSSNINKRSKRVVSLFEK